MKKILLYLLIFNYCSLVEAQTIELLNPSFEDTPSHTKTPKDWRDCGMPGETPPDTQPGAFKVVKAAHDGKTYLGMVTRETDTWEAVGQKLNTSLEAGACYYFSLHLARSEIYESRLRTDDIVSFTQPIKLKIWAGKNECDKKEFLAETSIVEHTDWQIYKFKLSPREDYDFIIFEAYYVTPVLEAYCGNILVDNCSSIVVGACESEEFSEYQKYAKASNGKEDRY